MNAEGRDNSEFGLASGEAGGSTSLWRIDAAGAADGTGLTFAPASLLVESRAVVSGMGEPVWRCRLVAVGVPGDIDRHPAAGAVAPERRRSLPESVILPGLVNAHTHLDLTHIGPRPYDPAGGFVGWAMSLVRPNRAITLETAIDSLRDGIARSLAGGVVAVGDIIGAVPTGSVGEPDARLVLRSELERVFGAGFGVGFGEVFGVGATQRFAIEQMERLAAAGCALQPHAPYSAGPGVYREAVRLAAARGVGLCTHLAETLDERRFIEHGDGPFRDLLERIGLWDDEAARSVGHGQHPIEHVLDAMEQNPGREEGIGSGRVVKWSSAAEYPHLTTRPLDHSTTASPPPSIPLRIGDTAFLAAHVNDCPERLIPRLAAARASVAYCPRAHEYFRHPETTGPHRYREMLEAGVNVCLGTDSIINLPLAQAGRISVLDDMRLLVRRDGVPPALALAMGTTRGARALGLNESAFTLEAGTVKAGLIAVGVGNERGDVLDRVMRADGVVQLLRWSDGSLPAGSRRGFGGGGSAGGAS
ncbi:MAG: amidohydrolase family protein [Phycisphaerales bacterium]